VSAGAESDSTAALPPGGLDRAAIEARLPHREPFLFLDRVVALEDAPEHPSLVAEWTVPPEAHFFRGHYPGNPITPGAILCEHAFQAAAMLLSTRGARYGATGDVPVLARIEKAKFRRMVKPGETVTTRVRLVEVVEPAAYVEAQVAVGSEVAVSLRCVLARAARSGS
jgi:3-hydroxyacyl-[acyl-carrier-protein] dehydratase